MYRDSIIYDFIFEFIPGFVAIIGSFMLVIAGVAVAFYTATSPPTCRAYGEKMQIEVDWGFWTGCMIRLHGQWLSTGDVIPVERDGKIVFAPKPVVRFQTDKAP